MPLHRVGHSVRALGVLLAIAAVFGGCTGVAGTITDPGQSVPTAGTSSLPNFSHVFIIVMENEGADAILGSASAPYINSLASRYTLAQRYFAVSHPSLPNYLALTSGSTNRYDGSDCSVDASVCHVAGTNTNITDEIAASGRTWRAYMEGMPQPCSLDNTDLYAVRHNPFVYYDDVRNGPDNRCGAHDVAYDAGQFQHMLAAEAVPNFVWITPNLCHDGHDDCGGDPIAHSDSWLQQNVPVILSSAAFQQDGVLFITWDEGAGSGACCGLGIAGGRVVTLVVSPLAKHSYQSDVAYTHFSLVRTIEDSWHLGELNNTNPAAEPGTVAMDDCFSQR